MTKEEFEHQHVSIINHLIDLNHIAADVWKFHPENPNRIDPVQYHEILVAKIAQIEAEEAEFVAKYGNI
jgi:hypothetical protein